MTVPVDEKKLVQVSVEQPASEKTSRPRPFQTHSSSWPQRPKVSTFLSSSTFHICVLYSLLALSMCTTLVCYRSVLEEFQTISDGDRFRSQTSSTAAASAAAAALRHEETSAAGLRSAERPCPDGCGHRPAAAAAAATAFPAHVNDRLPVGNSDFTVEAGNEATSTGQQQGRIARVNADQLNHSKTPTTIEEVGATGNEAESSTFLLPAAGLGRRSRRSAVDADQEIRQAAADDVDEIQDNDDEEDMSDEVDEEIEERRPASSSSEEVDETGAVVRRSRRQSHTAEPHQQKRRRRIQRQQQDEAGETTAEQPSADESTASTEHPHQRRHRKQRKTTPNNARGRQSATARPDAPAIPGPMSRAIHFQARDDVPKQYKSPPMVSFNTSAPGDTVYRFWRKSDWVSNETSQYFELLPSGHVVIKESGLYLIYAQMVYHDLTGRWSFGVYVDSSEQFKCLASEQLRDVNQLHPTSHGVYQQCNTASATYIRQYQHVYLRCMYGSRTILTQPEFTFWGIVRLS